MFFEVIGLATDPIFFSPLFFLIFFSVHGKIYEGCSSPPPFLYNPVSNPWPLHDDSLVGQSVDFFSGFTDSLLELGDLFVVFFVSLLGLLENLHSFIHRFGVATLLKATGALYLYELFICCKVRSR
jgi:hypothetical protein